MISYSNIKIFSKLAEAACPDAFVKGFSNPLLALKWLEEREASLIIADDKMPGMTGAELTRQVRHLPLCAEGPVIVVTAYHDQNFRVEVLEAGATDFLLSPTRCPMAAAQFQQILASRSVRLSFGQDMVHTHGKRLSGWIDQCMSN
jgi:CheY-like chemotaxis protein